MDLWRYHWWSVGVARWQWCRDRRQQNSAAGELPASVGGDRVIVPRSVTRPGTNQPLTRISPLIVQWNLSIVNSHGTQKNVHYTRVFTQEGWDMFMYTCACNTLKTVPSLLVRDSLGGRAIFHDSFSFFLNVMIYFYFLCTYMYIL